MNDINLKGKVAVVTGGARGIGKATVLRLLASGARCAIWDRDVVHAQSWVPSLAKADSIRVMPVELTQADSVAEAAAKTESVFGSIDIAVNNAGIAGVSKKLWECQYDEWREVIELDLMAVFYVCHALVPIMIKRGYGRIINIASIAGKEGNPNASHYSAAKAGVVGLTKSLGKELAETGVLVNCVTPAVIQTDILKQVSQEHIDYMVSKIPLKRVGQPEEVASLVAWLASEDCSFSTGAVFDISGGRATY
ncbi:MAG: SDR family NAD(P)-dependent oxidoreductase [Verrucomicrobiota bacterium]|nr:SDR family NAD(P)-dependent oxidoreductase [Verrucomicrobiota bacterium]